MTDISRLNICHLGSGFALFMEPIRKEREEPGVHVHCGFLACKQSDSSTLTELPVFLKCAKKHLKLLRMQLRES